MRYLSEFRNRDLVLALAGELKQYQGKEIRLMEVCGGHTAAIHRFGIPELLPSSLSLLSGPGCPVCVTSQTFIDKIIAHARIPGTIMTTYGDLIRVPGSESSLEKEKAEGRDVRIVYSVLQSLKIAEENPGSTVLFPGIGFETTAPATAVAVLQAYEKKLDNFFVISAHKIMPPVMKYLVDQGVALDGFIAPGHVTAITGMGIYHELPDQYGLGVVVTGFEPSDLLQAILMLVRQITAGKPSVENQYNRVVKPEGNPKALAMMEKVFEPCDDRWRGLGVIPQSGLKIREEYRQFDATRHFGLSIPEVPEPSGCICGSILRGIKTPAECPLFAKKCTPGHPVGACMVSGEGTCATYYKYRS
jgi:hydrogenase expression/formation protein HypD